MSNSLLQLDTRARLLAKLWNTIMQINWPLESRRQIGYWKDTKIGEARGPDAYVELQDEYSNILLDEVINRASSPTAPILDLGCNVGRHLNALYKRGFTNLYGVDVQTQALEHMATVFPELKAIVHVEHATFQDYLPRVSDCFFDIVFAFGQTVGLVPPSFPIVRHLARITRGAVILVISENGDRYPRLWEWEFARAGFLLTKMLRPLPGRQNNLSLLVFRRLTPPT